MLRRSGAPIGELGLDRLRRIAEADKIGTVVAALDLAPRRVDPLALRAGRCEVPADTRSVPGSGPHGWVRTA